MFVDAKWAQVVLGQVPLHQREAHDLVRVEGGEQRLIVAAHGDRHQRGEDLEGEHRDAASMHGALDATMHALYRASTSPPAVCS